MNKRILGITLLALALIALLTGAFVFARNADIVATVNGESITAQELDKLVDEVKAGYEMQGLDFSGEQGAGLLASLRNSILEQLINQKLMIQEAKKIETLSPARIDEIIDVFKQEFPSEEEYQAFIEELKMDQESIAYILNLQEYLTRDMPPVTDEEIRQFYDNYKEQMGQPEQLQVRHILFFVDEGDKGYPIQHTDEEAQQLAQNVIEQLKQGADFSELARTHSEDEGTKINGGLFAFSDGQAVAEFEQAAKVLQDGEFTETPVKTEFGYHVILREKVIPAVIPALEEVKDGIAQQLNAEAKQNKIGQYMTEAKNNAVIVNNLADQSEVYFDTEQLKPDK
ncbi:MAG: peptidylprolyl isomerase [Pelotomaculum sp.]|jgi:peptidyl-prolyl cis-trans isomerase C